MDKTLGLLSTGRPGVRIPGRGKCSLITIAVDERENYPLHLLLIMPDQRRSLMDKTLGISAGR